MSTSSPLPLDHPLMLAWTAHKTSPEYANTLSWAQHAAHTEGSLWAAFMAGWTAAGQAVAHSPRAVCTPQPTDPTASGD